METDAGAAPEGTAEDPFDQFLAQEQPAGAAAAEGDPHAQLLYALLEASKRQDQLLVKVCTALQVLDGKLEKVTAAQERLEAMMQAGPPSGSFSRPGEGRVDVRNTRGSIVQPPGSGGYVAQTPAAVVNRKEDDARIRQERLAAEQKMIEEETRRRAEELARKREEEERRRQEELERQRIAEEKRKEEERLRKEQLEKTTSGLMSNLVGGAGGSGLFGEEAAPKKKKGGLFDD